MNKSELELIQSKIYLVRGHKIMLDLDLAELYEVETKALNQAVRRNRNRFPEDFMFQLSDPEWTNLRSQIVTAKDIRKVRSNPFGFTQNGIAMISSVLTSKKAIEVNINIMRVFVKTSELMRNQAALYLRIDKIARQGKRNTEDIEKIFRAIDELSDNKSEDAGRRKIGFD